MNEEKHKKELLPYMLFQQLRKSVLTDINNIDVLEGTLWSDKLGIAGRVDCVAEYKGVLSVIDFKSSTNPRKEEYNENYYVQASAYCEMFEERTGTPVNQIVILVVTENGEVQEFVKNKKDYLSILKESIEIFSQKP